MKKHIQTRVEPTLRNRNPTTEKRDQIPEQMVQKAMRKRASVH